MAIRALGRILRFYKRMPPSTAIKLGGVAIALLATFLPLVFWPASIDSAAAEGEPQTYITAPPVAVVTSVLPDQTTTTLASPGSTTTTEPTMKITIAAVGDIIIHDSVLESAYNETLKTYDFTTIFAPIAPYLAAADYTVCNLESRMAGGTIVADEGSLRFNAPYSLSSALAAAGVDMCATASNHAADFGWLGIVRTLDQLDRDGIAHVGTARSLNEKETPVVVDIGGIKVGFLNYAAFVDDDADVSGNEEYAINVLQMDAAAEDAAAAREQGAEVVVAILHFGNEFLRTPTNQQTRTVEGFAGAEGLLSRGVDVILGTHPHVVQPIVKVVRFSNSDAGDAYAAYSLGNFLTGQRWRYTDSGIIAYVHIGKQGDRATVTGISYLPVYVQKSGEEVTTYRILPVLPGLTPEVDTAISPEDQARINQVWDELEDMLYRPDEGIVPVRPSDLGL